jgi:hypothetical protein
MARTKQVKKVEEIKKAEDIKTYDVVKMHPEIAKFYYFFLGVLVLLVGIGAIMKRIEWTTFFAMFAIGAYIILCTAIMVNQGMKVKR